jgi:DNA-binding CsgD family transcriptional regulator
MKEDDGSDGEVKMARDITITARELNPFEQLVLGLLCEGKTNAAIARETSHTEKVVENTISRAAKAFNIKSDPDTNIRVLLALAYRTHYGDAAPRQLRFCRWRGVFNATRQSNTLVSCFKSTYSLASFPSKSSLR